MKNIEGKIMAEEEIKQLQNKSPPHQSAETGKKKKERQKDI